MNSEKRPAVPLTTDKGRRAMAETSASRSPSAIRLFQREPGQNRDAGHCHQHAATGVVQSIPSETRLKTGPRRSAVWAIMQTVGNGGEVERGDMRRKWSAAIIGGEQRQVAPTHIQPLAAQPLLQRCFAVIAASRPTVFS
ncbi:MAG: hypothetical protein R2844_19865 [Caldilineales bacterium]